MTEGYQGLRLFAVSNQALIEIEDQLIKKWAGELKALKGSISALEGHAARVSFSEETVSSLPNSKELIEVRDELNTFTKSKVDDLVVRVGKTDPSDFPFDKTINYFSDPFRGKHAVFTQRKTV